MAEDSGRPLPDVARAYALTRDAFGVLDVNTAIDALDTHVSGAVQTALYAAVQRFTIDRMSWFMRHADFGQGLATLIERFRVKDAKPAEGVAEGWTARGVPAPVAASMARLAAVAAMPDAVLVAERSKVDAPRALATMRALAQTLEIDRMRATAESVAAADSYERQALMQAADSIDASLRSLAVEVLASGQSGEEGVRRWAEARRAGVDRMKRTLADVLSGQPSLAKASVAAGALRDLTTA